MNVRITTVLLRLQRLVVLRARMIRFLKGLGRKRWFGHRSSTIPSSRVVMVIVIIVVRCGNAKHVVLIQGRHEQMMVVTLRIIIVVVILSTLVRVNDGQWSHHRLSMSGRCCDCYCYCGWRSQHAVIVARFNRRIHGGFGGVAVGGGCSSIICRTLVVVVWHVVVVVIPWMDNTTSRRRCHGSSSSSSSRSTVPQPRRRRRRPNFVPPVRELGGLSVPLFRAVGRRQ
mmetsp:Transcript_13315/g.29285  ORF Transcript_13315/g.29285 Transcript_13315/m.29285 type:complete len:227 (+) Transcript_13315:3538-4218(+)